MKLLGDKMTRLISLFVVLCLLLSGFIAFPVLNVTEEEAEEKAHHGEGYSEVHDSTDWSGYIETTVESEEDNEEI